MLVSATISLATGSLMRFAGFPGGDVVGLVIRDLLPNERVDCCCVFGPAAERPVDRRGGMVLVRARRYG